MISVLSKLKESFKNYEFTKIVDDSIVDDENLPYTEFIVTLVGNNVSVTQSDQGGKTWVNDESARVLQEHLAKREQVVNALNELVTPLGKEDVVEVVKNNIQQGLDVLYPADAQSKPSIHSPIREKGSSV